MAPQKIKKAHKQLLSAIIPSLINDLYREGILSDKDLDDNTLLRKKLEDYLDKKELNLQIVIDHRETILNAAEREFKAGNSDFSIALFATFIEHTLNRLIHIECERKEIDKKTSTEIIKSVSMIGKCTWLLKLLGLPPLRSEYLKTIIKIAEERNSYIHYKWKPEPDSDKVPNLKNEDIKKREKYLETKKLLKYLKNYETRYEYAGKKNKIRTVAFI